MSKEVLILVLSSDFEPYSKMISTSRETWDSVQVKGVESIFYCSKKDNPNAVNHDNVMYFDVPNGLYDMNRKNIAMYDWALKNKDFDFVCRVNASCFVNKKNLIEFIQTLPDGKVFVGAEVTDSSKTAKTWYWGGCSFIFSRDVLQILVDSKQLLNHSEMEDKATSYIINMFDINIIPAKSCSIDNMGECWRCMMYGGGDSFEFTNFEDIKKAEGHFLFRIKQDGHRDIDETIMRELFNVLK